MKEILIDLFLCISVFFRPKFWFLKYPYSKDWNAELLNLLETDQFRPVGRYSVKIKDRLVWVDVSPKNSFLVFVPRGNTFVRPSRLTMLKAYIQYNKLSW